MIAFVIVIIINSIAELARGVIRTYIPIYIYRVPPNICGLNNEAL